MEAGFSFDGFEEVPPIGGAQFLRKSPGCLSILAASVIGNTLLLPIFFLCTLDSGYIIENVHRARKFPPEKIKEIIAFKIHVCCILNVHYISVYGVICDAIIFDFENLRWGIYPPPSPPRG